MKRWGEIGDYGCLGRKDDGEFVAYSEAQAALAEKEAEVKRLRELLNRSVPFLNLARARSAWTGETQHADALIEEIRAALGKGEA